MRRRAALANIARIRVRDGEPGEAAQPFALALESAGAIPDGSRRASGLAEIVELQLDYLGQCPGVSCEPDELGVRVLFRADQKGS